MNNFRRPANYVSRGYLTRRMAVDFSIPLITNIKCAKLFIEALIRVDDMPIRPYDFKSNYETVNLPGLIDIHTVLASPDQKHLEQVTKAAIAGGFTSLAVDGSATTYESLQALRALIKGNAYTDVTAIASVEFDAQGASSHASLHKGSKDIFALLFSPNLTVSQAAKVINAWPHKVPLMTTARGTDLAAMLLLANLNDRPVHVSQVTKKEDMKLIQAAKAKGMPVSCDVSVYSLFFTAASVAKDSPMPSDLFELNEEDQDHLWKSLPSIDLFSVGGIALPNGTNDQLTALTSQRLREALPLLLTAVAGGKLTIGDIKERLYDAPLRLFNLPVSATSHSTIEVEIDREFTASQRWPADVLPSLNVKALKGVVNKVSLHGKVVYQDDRLIEETLLGQEIALFRPAAAATAEDLAAAIASSTEVPIQTIASTVVPSGSSAPESPGRPATMIQKQNGALTGFPQPSPALASLSLSSAAAAVTSTAPTATTVGGSLGARHTSIDWSLTSPVLPAQSGYAFSDEKSKIIAQR